MKWSSLLDRILLEFIIVGIAKPVVYYLLQRSSQKVQDRTVVCRKWGVEEPKQEYETKQIVK